MSVCGYIRIYLAVYGPENKGASGREEKKNVCRLRSRKNKLWRFAECATPIIHMIIDPLKIILFKLALNFRLLYNTLYDLFFSKVRNKRQTSSRIISTLNGTRYGFMAPS